MCPEGAAGLQRGMSRLLAGTQWAAFRWHAGRWGGGWALCRLGLPLPHIMFWGRWATASVARLYCAPGPGGPAWSPLWSPPVFDGAAWRVSWVCVGLAWPPALVTDLVPGLGLRGKRGRQEGGEGGEGEGEGEGGKECE